MNGDPKIFLHILFHILISTYYEKFCKYLMTFNTSNLSLFKISLAFLMKGGHFDYPSLSQDFEWKPYLEMVLIYQVLTRQCLKKVFLTSNDFVPNDSSLLNGPNFGIGTCPADKYSCRNQHVYNIFQHFPITLHFQVAKPL